MIELVIKIPEEVVKNGDYVSYFGVVSEKLVETFKNSISLPKEHGRIGDLDALEQEMVNGIKASNYEDGYDDYSHINNIDDCVDCVRYADTIIKAVKKER